MTEPEPEVRERQIRDPRALRALAHPVRLRILDELGFGGPLTATELSERIGESAANCSWHLRQLAQYGYIEETGGGAGRQRPWRVAPVVTSWGGPDEEPELARAGDAAAELLNERDFDELRNWLHTKRAEPAQWQDAAIVTRTLTWLTPDELKELGAEVSAIWVRYRGRVTDPSRRPPGSRPVRMVAWGVPVGSRAPDSESAQERPGSGSEA
jgi:DNA-binding transcriptional ArsR family regulator